MSLQRDSSTVSPACCEPEQHRLALLPTEAQCRQGHPQVAEQPQPSSRVRGRGMASLTAHTSSIDHLQLVLPGSFGLVAEPSQATQASPSTLTSPLGPRVSRQSTYQAGVAQSPVVLAGVSKRRTEGGFSSSIMPKSCPESEKCVWISLWQTN